MWQDWQTSGQHPEKLRPLIKSLQPVVQDHVNRHWRPTLRVPQEAVRAELEDQMMRAFETFNPDRGARLSSWVQTNMRKVSRFVKTHQNVARITNKRLDWIGDYHSAVEEMTKTLGRAPTSVEIADKISSPMRPISPQDVERMEREDVRDVAFSQRQDEDELMDAIPSQLNQKLMLLKYELTPDELYVLERLQGWGVPVMKQTQIARSRGWSDAKVNRLKKAIAKKAKEIL